MGLLGSRIRRTRLSVVEEQVQASRLDFHDAARVRVRRRRLPVRQKVQTYSVLRAHVAHQQMVQHRGREKRSRVRADLHPRRGVGENQRLVRKGLEAEVWMTIRLAEASDSFPVARDGLYARPTYLQRSQVSHHPFRFAFVPQSIVSRHDRRVRSHGVWHTGNDVRATRILSAHRAVLAPVRALARLETNDEHRACVRFHSDRANRARIARAPRARRQTVRRDGGGARERGASAVPGRAREDHRARRRPRVGAARVEAHRRVRDERRGLEREREVPGGGAAGGDDDVRRGERTERGGSVHASVRRRSHDVQHDH